MSEHEDRFEELQAPPVVFPGQAGPESAYRTAFDLLARRAPREALEVIEPALEQEPANTGLRTLRAWAYLMRAQLQRAETELRSLVDDNPTDDWSRHALGRCLERQSRYAEALPHLRLAAAMSGDPDHGLAALRVEQLVERLDGDRGVDPGADDPGADDPGADDPGAGPDSDQDDAGR